MFDQLLINLIWLENVDVVECYNEFGVFMIFVVYEYILVMINLEDGIFGGGNFYCNVFFCGVVFVCVFLMFDFINFEDLWDWMDEICSDGFEVIVVLYNLNVLDGQMFKLEIYDGVFLMVEYVDQCMCNELLVEVI